MSPRWKPPTEGQLDTWGARIRVAYAALLQAEKEEVKLAR